MLAENLSGVGGFRQVKLPRILETRKKKNSLFNYRSRTVHPALLKIFVPFFVFDRAWENSALITVYVYL
jgi:hypothetical protein